MMYFTRRTRFALANVVLAMVSGCHSASTESDYFHTPELPTSSMQTASYQQLIIKFRPDTVPCDEAGIARFSAVTKVQLTFVRTMSGQACVIRQLMDQEGGFLQGQTLLRQHPDVEWVELDAIMKAL